MRTFLPPTRPLRKIPSVNVPSLLLRVCQRNTAAFSPSASPTVRRRFDPSKQSGCALSRFSPTMKFGAWRKSFPFRSTTRHFTPMKVMPQKSTRANTPLCTGTRAPEAARVCSGASAALSQPHESMAKVESITQMEQPVSINARTVRAQSPCESRTCV